MSIFDLYRPGYELGYQHGYKNERRRANWELLISSPITWLPLTNIQSFVDGYKSGYDTGSAFNKWQKHRN